MLFSTTSLEPVLEAFSLTTVVDIAGKRDIIQHWISKAESGLLDNYKESAIAGDFITDIFCKVLDYQQSGPTEWNLEKEPKTLVDGQTPDAAVGFFKDILERKMVSGVIEMKDYTTSLDKKQTRPTDKRTPVEQAFQYAPKFGMSCKWVFVSNMKEIRLYHASSALDYESFMLPDLVQEDQLRKFIYLCGRDRLISHTGESSVERLLNGEVVYDSYLSIRREGHLIDKLYFSLRRFDGINYFDPNILANTDPFHNGQHHVWRYYDLTIGTPEPGFYQFFSSVYVADGEISINESFKAETEQLNVIEVDRKVDYIIRRLNELMVFKIQCYEDVKVVTAAYNASGAIGKSMDHELRDYKDQLRTIDINLHLSHSPKGSLSEFLDNFQYQDFLGRLYSWEGTKKHLSRESLVGHTFLASNNYKRSYAILNDILAKEKGKNPFAFFIAMSNKKILFNLLRSAYWYEDREQLLADIRGVNLVDTLYELNIYDPDVRKVFDHLLNDTLRRKAISKIEYLTEKLQTVKDSFERGDTGMFPNYTWQLLEKTLPYYASVHLNGFLIEQYTDHKKVSLKFINAFLISFTTNEAYYGKARGLTLPIFQMIVHDLRADEFNNLLQKHNVENIYFLDNQHDACTSAILSYIKSRRSKHFFWGPSTDNTMDKALSNWDFKERYYQGFGNLFLILSKIEMNHAYGKEIITELKHCIEISEELVGYRLNYLSNVLTNFRLGHTYKEVASLLLMLIRKEDLTDLSPVRETVQYILFHHPDWLEEDEVLWSSFLSAVEKKRVPLCRVMHFYPQLWESAQLQFDSLVTSRLKESFDRQIYIRTLNHEILSYAQGGFFKRFLNQTKKLISSKPYKVYNGKPKNERYHFVNFLLPVYQQNIPVARDCFGELLPWQEWAFNPENFPPEQFNVEWLHLFYERCFHQRFAKLEYVISALKTSLREDPINHNLRDLYLTHYL